MGERAFDGPATDDDLETMVAELRSALRAGAAGFSTSRSPGHQTSDDRPVASRVAAWDEVVALVEVLGRESSGIFQLAQERHWDPEAQRDFESRLGQLAVSSGARIAFGMFASEKLPEVSLETIEGTAARGGELYGMTHCRGVNSAHSFLTRLGFDGWLSGRRCAAGRSTSKDGCCAIRRCGGGWCTPHTTAATEPPRARGRPPGLRAHDRSAVPYLKNPTVAEEARRRGVDPVEAMIDIALERDFDVFFLQPLVLQDDEETLIALMRHPHTAMCASRTRAPT